MADKKIQSFFDGIAASRQTWKSRHLYYHADVKAFIRSHVREHDTVREIGSSIGDILGHLSCRRAVGIDFSQAMVRLAQRNYPDRTFLIADAENIPVKQTFDRIILAGTLGVLPDIQRVFEQIHACTGPSSRVIITYYNHLWEPLLKLAERIHLKMPKHEQNWLPLGDIENLLYLSGFEIVKKGYRLLFPKYIPLISVFLNRIVARLPLIRRLCLIEWIIAKPAARPLDPASVTCSVIIPCRNERDNIAQAVSRTPDMGKHTELIFVDGSSDDGTVEEIQRAQKEHPRQSICLIPQGSGRGKGDAVRKGLEAATGDILLILDADLTVPPEDLPKFFDALIQGKGDFINGSRMVYPMEKQAMRIINHMGNKFFSLAFTYLLEQRFRDTLCGTKVLWKQDYQNIKAGRNYFGEFDPFGDFDLIFGASRQDLKIVEVPVRYRERVYGTTKIRRWVHGWLLLKMCWVAMKKLKFAA